MHYNKVYSIPQLIIRRPYIRLAMTKRSESYIVYVHQSLYASMHPNSTNLCLWEGPKHYSNLTFKSPLGLDLFNAYIMHSQTVSNSIGWWRYRFWRVYYNSLTCCVTQSLLKSRPHLDMMGTMLTSQNCLAIKWNSVQKMCTCVEGCRLGLTHSSLRKQHFLWWSFCNIYTHQSSTLYIWKLHSVTR